MRRLVLSTIALLLIAACNNKAQLTTTSFAMPVGLAVAGTIEPHLFVANADEDTVQIVKIPQFLSDTNFVRGPNLYFPLRIPAGSRPTRLAASEDGRYIIVLDSATSALTLLDADAFVKATDIIGNEIELALTQRGATPTDMVASTVPCPSGTAERGCLGRVYIALAANRVVLVVDLVTGLDGTGNVIAGPFFSPVRAYDVGGEPQRLALSWDGAYLYATDNLAQQVVRIGLTEGSTSVERRDLGGVGGPLAVSRDNEVLLVGRPQSRDVVVMQGAHDASWAIFDANPLFTPQPRCLTDCADGLNVNAEIEVDPATGESAAVRRACVEPQLADVAICVDNASGGIRSSGQPPYTAIYVDGAPSLITTLGAAGGNPPLLYTCNDGDVDLDNDGQISDEEDARDSSISVSYGEYALIVTEGDRSTGDIYWMPLRVSQGAPLTPQLASAACGRPALDVNVELVDGGDVEDFGPYQIGNYMAPCVDTPDRARFTCATDAAGGGVVVVSGNVPILAQQNSGPLARQARWDFTWEGVIPGLDRSNGGGEIVQDPKVDSDGNVILDLNGNPVLDVAYFRDVGLHFEDFQRIRKGDILEVVGAPIGSPECVAAIGEDRRTCQFERIIDSIDRSTDGDDRVRINLQLLPNDPLTKGCFLNQGRVAYRIRVGNQFLVTRQGVPEWRLGLDKRFGPGGDVAPNESIIFQLRDDLLTNAPAGTSACERYDVDGRVLEGNGQSFLLARDVKFGITVTDAFRPYLTGRAYASSGQTLGSAGSIPGDIVVYQAPPTPEGAQVNPRVFITYSGADTLIGMDPTSADDASRGIVETQFILRN